MRALRKLLKASDRVLVFSGAGVSVDSGIPDFRTPGGIWDRIDPMSLHRQAIETSPTTRARFWQAMLALHESLGHPKPNPSHDAVTKLQRLGKLVGVVTQNVDGLHQASGTEADRVIELHGNTQTSYCVGCRTKVPTDAVLERIRGGDPAPNCEICGEYLRPDLVCFGDPLDERDVSRAWALAERCDLCLVLGSSLIVTPAADLPVHARRSGAKLAIVTLGPTPLDGLADLRIDAPLADVWVPAVARL